MKALFILLNFILIFLFFGFTFNKPNEDGPKIEFKTMRIDFGTIDHRKPCEIPFEFKNSGNQDLIITQVKSSCGCLAPMYSSEPVKPGETGLITLKYDSNRLGPTLKSVTVYCNDKNTPVIVLTIKGEICPLFGETK